MSPLSFNRHTSASIILDAPFYHKLCLHSTTILHESFNEEGAQEVDLDQPDSTPMSSMQSLDYSVEDNRWMDSTQFPKYSL